MVYGTAVRLLGDASEAQDVSQTVFLRAFQHFDRLRADAAAGWLRTVTRNLCLNHLTRFRARWRLFSESGRAGTDSGGPFEDSIASAGTQTEDLLRKEEHARLERGIRSLPRHQRVPIVLYHFEQCSYREIAALLDVSLAKVKTDIHRGRRALRALMEPNNAPR